jgi:hypothetical protein
MKKKTKDRLISDLTGAAIALSLSVITFFLPRIFKENNNSKLVVVDVSFEISNKNDNIFSPLNIWIKNEGPNSALVKRLKIEFLHQTLSPYFTNKYISSGSETILDEEYQIAKKTISSTYKTMNKLK